MYLVKSYLLTIEEFNYLLPAIKNKLLSRMDSHYFIGSFESLADMINRLKGLYENYNEVNPMTIYECSKQGSLEPFRNSLKNTNPKN